MQTVNIKTRCQTCKEDMDKVLLEKIAKLEEENKSLKKKNEFLLKVNDLLEEENLDYRYDILDTAYDQATEMARNWEEQYKYEIAVLEKALELLKDKNNYHNFVDERTEIIDVDFAILKAKEELKSE